MRAHILEHDPDETIGSIGDWLERCQARVRRTRVFAGEPLPDPADADLFVLMGGMMSVNDEPTLPWITAEKSFIRDVIARETPLLGICFGSQIIASALGAVIRRSPDPEHGWFPIEREGTHTNRFNFPSACVVFHSHGDAFDLPPGAARLARSAACPNQAFQVGRRVMGIQFHLESTPESARIIAEECADESPPGPYVQPVETLRAVPASAYAESVRLMGEVLNYLTA